MNGFRLTVRQCGDTREQDKCIFPKLALGHPTNRSSQSASRCSCVAAKAYARSRANAASAPARCSALNLFGRPALPRLRQYYHPVAAKAHQDFIFNALVNKAFFKAVRPKSEHFRVPNCNYVFSDSRDSTGCLCGLHIANKDRARGILFLAPPRVLVGRSHAVWARSQTQAHKPWIGKGKSVLAGRSKGSD